jgi:aminoglycoside 3-N-acetyltransferase
MSSERLAIADMLEGAKVPRDGILFVHSAFRRLGAQGFRVHAFIEALMDYMWDGTLVMPTMSWRIVTPASPVFDELATPSHVGVLAERYRIEYATHRSLHPTHSVAAWGKLAEMLTAAHHLDDTPCSLDSPYGRATGHEAFILLLGVGLERCTAIHHVEERVAPDVYLQPSSAAEIYQCRGRDGAVHTVRLRRHLRLNRDFPQFAAPLLGRGEMRHGDLAGTPWLCVAQSDLLREVTEALDHDPRAIIAPPGAPVIP